MAQRRRNQLAFNKNFYRGFFKRLNHSWPSEASFIFIRLHRRDCRLIFVDELNAEESLRLAREHIPRSFLDSRHFGFYLRARRKALKMTLRQLSLVTGIAVPNLSVIENGRRNVGPKTRRRLELFLGPMPDPPALGRAQEASKVIRF